MKEQKYKNFFKEYDKSLHNRMDNHIKKVVQEKQMKDSQLAQSQKLAEDEYNKKLQAKEVQGK
jgi:hypothetical protein